MFLKHVLNKLDHSLRSGRNSMKKTTNRTSSMRQQLIILLTTYEPIQGETMTPPCNHCYKSSSGRRQSTPSLLLQHCRIPLVKSDGTELLKVNANTLNTPWFNANIGLSCPEFGLSGVAHILPSDLKLCPGSIINTN